jgi:hypothetical protein
MRSFVDEHRQQVAQFLLQSQLRVQLVQNRHLLHGGNGRIQKNSRSSALPSQVARKSSELPVDGRRIELWRR